MEQTDLLLRADQWQDKMLTVWSVNGPPFKESRELVRDLVLALRHQQDKLVEQRVLGHGEGQEHAIADVNAGRVDDLIAPRLKGYEQEADRLTTERCEAIARAEKADAHCRQLQADQHDAELKFVDAHEDWMAAEREVDELKAEVRRGQAAQAALVGRWRATADALVDDVNNGHAPSHESDFARGMLSCADELAALISPAPVPEPLTMMEHHQDPPSDWE